MIPHLFHLFKECVSTVMLSIVIVYILTGEIYPITKNGQEQYFFIAFSLKICSNEQVYPYDGRYFLWIENENLNFSTTKMAAVLISTRNA